MDGHSHSLGCGCQSSAADEGEVYSLYRHVGVSVRLLNSSDAPSAALKPHVHRKDGRSVCSDDDEGLLFFIPFTGVVKLKSLCFVVVGAQRPATCRLYKNVESLAFDDVHDMKCTEEITLAEDDDAAITYALPATKFADVRSIALYFPSAVGDDVVRVHYIGLNGDYQKVQRAVLGVVYESAPQMADHPKAKGDTGNRNTIM